MSDAAMLMISGGLIGFGLGALLGLLVGRKNHRYPSPRATRHGRWSMRPRTVLRRTVLRRGGGDR